MKKTLQTTPARLVAPFSLRQRTGGILAVAALLSLGLFASSRPAHTASGPIPVNVANTVQTKDMASPSKQPFQMLVHVAFNDNAAQHLLVHVPAGKRLVIESLMAVDDLYCDKTAYDIFLSDDAAALNSSGYMGLALTPSPDPYSNKTQTGRLTAEAGQNMNVYVDSSKAGPAALDVTVSGYYVDVP